MFNEKDINEYYNETESQYKRNWKLNDCMALHYGYVDENHRSFKKSLINMNRVLLTKADVNSESHVLDAGCGVGGTAIFFAQNSACHVTGISINEKQIELAKQNAKKFNISDKTNFEVQSYLSTHFDDNSFDVVIAIESSCHAPTISDFTKEAYRILKVGGRLVFSDYIKNKSLTKAEDSLIKKWVNGWAINDLPNHDNVVSALQNFSSFEYEDATKHIYKSSRHMYHRYLIGYIPQKIYESLFNVSIFLKGNFAAAKYQYNALKKKLWTYHIYTAIK